MVGETIVGKLVFVGMGLYNEEDMTLRGMEEIRNADTVFAETYTSLLSDGTLARIERITGRRITILPREDVEGERIILDEAIGKNVVLLVAGDPFAATTHVSLRLAAVKSGIPVSIVHNASIITAAAGALGLQQYKFGRTASIPFPSEGYRPETPYDVISANRLAGLHTLVLLDLKPEENRYMTAAEGLEILLEIGRSRGDMIMRDDLLVCVVERAGWENCATHAGPVSTIRREMFGKPPHCIVVPGDLHFMEREALAIISRLS